MTLHTNTQSLRIRPASITLSTNLVKWIPLTLWTSGKMHTLMLLWWLPWVLPVWSEYTLERCPWVFLENMSYMLILCCMVVYCAMLFELGVSVCQPTLQDTVSSRSFRRFILQSCLAFTRKVLVKQTSFTNSSFMTVVHEWIFAWVVHCNQN